MVGYSSPYADSPIGSGAPASYYQNLYKSAFTPINNNAPIQVLWYPVAENGFKYDQFLQTTAPIVTTSSPNTTDIPVYEMGVLVVGSLTSSGGGGNVFEVTVVVNYEFIPISNVANLISSAPSPSDAQEVDLVENWVQDLPVVEMTTSRVVGASPDASKVEDPGESSGFGMFYEVIKEVAPLALGALSLL
jgi:hypothetical protein